MYTWIISLNVLAVAGFILMHIAAAIAAFRLRGESDRERVRALRGLGVVTMAGAYIFLGLFLLSGATAGYVRGLWGSGWIWLALGLFIGICILMWSLSRRYFARIRRGTRVRAYRQSRRRPGRPQTVSR